MDHWNPVLCQIVLLLRCDLERDYRLLLVVFFSVKMKFAGRINIH